MESTDGFDMIDPSAYAKRGAPHGVWQRLRRDSPIHRCEPAGYEPFWVITRHADVCEISEHPDEFAKLKRNPELIKPAVEEMVRWTSPVNYMKRTADCRLPIRYRITPRS